MTDRGNSKLDASAARGVRRPGLLAILQARTTSSRLPDKVLKPLLGVPMLLRQIERVRRSRHIDRLVVATSDDSSDDAIAALCGRDGIDCFRGSLADVLDRFYQAALRLHPPSIVRLTGDCPLADPAVIDKVIDFYRDGRYDYASNAVEPTFPDGLDVEVFSFDALETAWRETGRGAEREHVTLYIYRHPDRFRIGHFKMEPDLSRLRWTVDEPADFEFVTAVYEALYPANPAFTMEHVLAYLERRPDLAGLNSTIARNEGLRLSLERDATHPKA
jgi:spore coat polysaccharide biosynthesis protein SpsF